MHIEPVIPHIRLRFSLSEKLCNHQVATPNKDTRVRSPYQIGSMADIVYANCTTAVKIALLAMLHTQPFFYCIQQPVTHIRS